MRRKRLFTYGGWLVAVLIVVAMARRFDVHEVAVQMRKGDWRATLPFAAGLPVAWLLVGSYFDRLVFARVLGGPRWSDILRGRSATALLGLFGYAAGNGAIGVWLARKTKAPAILVTSAVLYTMLADLGGLGLVTSAAVYLGHPAVPASVGPIALGMTVVPLAVGILARPVLRGTTSRFLTAWREIAPAMGLLQIVARGVDFAFVCLAIWGGSRAFGLAIPLPVFATYMPLIGLSTTLPFNIAGIGAAQAAWLVFSPWEPGERLIAFQLVWSVLTVGAIIVRGLPFVRSALHELRD